MTEIPFIPGSKVRRVIDGARGTVESVTPYVVEASDTFPASDWSVVVRLDSDGEAWSGTENAWEQTCSSVEVGGHVYADRADSEYVSMVGWVRMWQDCTGCGNVTTRLADVSDFLAQDIAAGVAIPEFVVRDEQGRAWVVARMVDAHSPDSEYAAYAPTAHADETGEIARMGSSAEHVVSHVVPNDAERQNERADALCDAMRDALAKMGRAQYLAGQYTAGSQTVTESRLHEARTASDAATVAMWRAFYDATDSGVVTTF